MHRLFGIIGCVISSATLFTWGFIAMYGNEFNIRNCIVCAVAFGLIGGVALALSDKVTKRDMGNTIVIAAVAAAITIILAIKGMDGFQAGDFVMDAILIGIGVAIGGLNGFFYWLSTSAYTHVRFASRRRGNPSTMS